MTKDWELFPQLAARPSAPPAGSRAPGRSEPALESRRCSCRWPSSQCCPDAVRCARSATCGRESGVSALRDGCGRLYLDADLVRLSPDISPLRVRRPGARSHVSAELLGCPIVVSFRGYDLNYVGLDEPDYYARRLVAGGRLSTFSAKTSGAGRGGGDVRPTRLLPRPDPARRSTRSSSRPAPGRRRRREGERPLRILSVGRLEWKKGYEDALVAVRKLARSRDAAASTESSATATFSAPWASRVIARVWKAA